jgi:hypothetical protein
VVRPLEAADEPAVRALFLATAAAGRPLQLDAADMAAYADLCLGWYLDVDGSACAVLQEGDAVVGYAMVALDDAAHARWVRPRALRWGARGLGRMPLAPTGDAAAFTRRRILDGLVTAVRGVAPPMPAHFHFNVAGSRRGTTAGFLLAGHADRVVRHAGLPGYYGEVNVPVAKAGRALALQRLGARVVHRQRNHTLSWLAGEPVDRLTVVRSLDPADGWYPLPHSSTLG